MLKRVYYRGGLASFEIPASWVEEYDPEGGATFYEDSPDSGTLRLNVLSFAPVEVDAVGGGFDQLISEHGFFSLGNGLALKRSVKFAEQRSEALKLYCWDVAVSTESSTVRLAVFSYTILASKGDDPDVHGEIALLDHCIRSGTYSREPSVSGACAR